MLNALLLLNPADVYRLFNLTGFANVSTFSGMAGLAGSAVLSPTMLLAALAAWTLPAPRPRGARLLAERAMRSPALVAALLGALDPCRLHDRRGRPRRLLRRTS